MKKGGEEIRSYHSEKIEKIMKEIEEEEYFEKLEMEYFRELEQRREIAKNFTGQVAGRHPDAFGHSEMMHMNRGYIEGYKKAKETLYTEEQVRKAISKAFDYHYTNGLLSEIALLDIIQSLKQPKK